MSASGPTGPLVYLDLWFSMSVVFCICFFASAFGISVLSLWLVVHP